MKVKRYFAASMRSALDMVKQEQGPDVLILSNRKVDGGVELITADAIGPGESVELARHDASSPRQEFAVGEAQAAKPATMPVAKRHPLLPPGTETAEYLWTDAGTVAQMREELRNLKGLLESQLSGFAWSEFGTRHPLRARLLRVLAQVGICPGLARSLVDKIPDDLDYRAGWHRALALLVTRLPTQPDAILRDGGCIALLGPTGVGKSTVVSKLAARYALEHGADRVTIVSMDDRRVGAHQQMKTFGSLLGVSVLTARKVGDLARQLQDQAGKSLVLIDTPGHAPGDRRYRELALELRQMDGANRSLRILSGVVRPRRQSSDRSRAPPPTELPGLRELG